MLRRLLIIAACVLLLIPDYSLAAKKKKKPKKPKKPPEVVDLTQVVTIQVNITDGKKQKSVDVTCYKNEPGVLGKKGAFDSYSKLMKGLKSKAKKDKKARKRLATYRQINEVAKSECAQPDYLSLEPYRGSFTAREAHTLYERFSFGAPPEQIAQAVAAGLDRTVDNLLTPKPEPWLDADEAELRCDGYLADDTRNESNDPEECPPGHRNAVSDSGLRFDLYNRMWRSSNGFFLKFWLFLHDERMAAGTNVLSSCDRYAAIDHINLLRRAAGTGDYVQFMREWNNDYLGHLVWLDGASNTGQSPNENYAREFWELGTVGPTALDGSPVYTDLDIAQSALAFSGWIRDYDEFVDGLGDEYGVCFGAKAPLQHAPGGKRIFGGTPYEKIVDTDEDVLQATMAHPRMAEHLAEDLWKEFINPYAREKEIKQLAQLIRDNNYRLLPVFRVMMRSRAMFAPRSHKSIIKQPLDLVFGFLRQTGIPLIDSTYFDNNTNQTRTSSSRFERLEWNVIEDLGQIPLHPPTVFGWNERRLAGELYVLPWRNAVMWLVNNDPDDLAERAGFSYRARYFADLPPAGLAAGALVDKIAAVLNVELNANQKSHLVTFLDYDYVRCSNSERSDPSKGCDTNGNRLKYRVFDPHPQSEEANVTDLRGMLAIVAMDSQYRMK